MRHVEVFKDPRIYASHASACQAGNGDILVAFRQAPFEHIYAHVHPAASVGLMRSSDAGETWQPACPSAVLDPGDEVNVGSPSLTTLRDGTIILTAFVLPCPWRRNEARWRGRAVPVEGNDYLYVPDEQQVIVRRSFDNGLTWDGPYTVDTAFYGGGSCGVRASVIETSDGTLLMPINGEFPDTNEKTAALVYSTDKGETWEPYSLITSWKVNQGQARCFGLPSVIAYDDNHLLAAGSCVREPGTFVTSSEDGGCTWSELRPVETRGACTHLCRVGDAATLLSYGHHHYPYGIRMMPSCDDGRTWDPERVTVVRSDGAGCDLGSPWTLRLSNGTLFCVYYFNTGDADKSYYDEENSLAICEQWGLDPDFYTYRRAGLRFIGATLVSEEEVREFTDPAASERGEPMMA